MPIPKHLKLFNLKMVRQRTKIETRGIRMAHAALVKQYYSFEEQLMYVSNRDQLIPAADNIKSTEIEKFLKQYYGMFAPIALMYRKNAVSQKSAITGIQYKAAEDDEYLAIFQQYLQGLLNGPAGKSITTITGTSQNKIKGIIRNILSDAEFEGKGIEEVKRRIMKEVGQNLRGNGWARSRAIAQTEMIKASNEAADYAVKSTGFDHLKILEYIAFGRNTAYALKCRRLFD